MPEKWESIFDHYGIKTVTNTDKSKSAYVPEKNQCRAIAAAGVKPSDIKPTPEIILTVLFEKSRKTVISGYYHSERSIDAARSPEPRMGKELINRWLEPKDVVLIGNIGNQLFTFKLSSGIPSIEACKMEVAHRSSRQTIVARANAAVGLPAIREVTRTEFVRDPFVVLGALERAKGQCEAPGCSHALFQKDDGTFYLEVHHIIPLGIGGDDTLLNVAALCPHCHRELHSGIDRTERQKILQSRIASKLLF